MTTFAPAADAYVPMTSNVGEEIISDLSGAQVRIHGRLENFGRAAADHDLLGFQLVKRRNLAGKILPKRCAETGSRGPGFSASPGPLVRRGRRRSRCGPKKSCRRLDAAAWACPSIAPRARSRPARSIPAPATAAAPSLPSNFLRERDIRFTIVFGAAESNCLARIAITGRTGNASTDGSVLCGAIEGSYGTVMAAAAFDTILPPGRRS